MRVVAQIPHPKMAISIFQMNDKYLIKFEAGPMEQTYKLNQSEVNGIDGIKNMIDAVFLENVIQQFNNMFLACKEMKQRYEKEAS